MIMMYELCLLVIIGDNERNDEWIVDVREINRK